jgi:Ca2+-binding RTX toxin-like protein
VLVLVVAGQLARAAAGPGRNDIEDTLPFWASDGVHIAFDRGGGGAPGRVLVTTSAGKGTNVVAPGFARGWLPGSDRVLVQTSDGSDTIALTNRLGSPSETIRGVMASPSPDGKRIAYLRDDVLYVANADGSNEREVDGVRQPSWDLTGPAWAPDGSRFAIATVGGLAVVNADGSGLHVVYRGSNQSVNPSWSADGKTIAFEDNGASHWQIRVVAPDGSGSQVLISSATANFRYPQFSPVSNTLAFISDLQHVPGGATRYQYALYLRDPSGIAHKLVDDVHPYSPPRWSPTAALIAVSAGQECRRFGIYVVRGNVGSRATRRSNICRFDGAAGNDTLGGTPYFDIMNGNGGDDVIRGLGGNDKISGEDGSDTILAGDGNDFVLAGPGNDRIFGGAGDDVIVPGNGRDVVDCGPGNDTVEGAGPLDRIARNCEHVRR